MASLNRPLIGILGVIFIGALLITPSLEFIDHLQKVTAVAFQISSLNDLIMDECNDQNEEDKSEQFKDCKWFEDNLLTIEIFIRVFTLIS